MPLIVTPPKAASSLWQAICRRHGVLIRSVPPGHALLAAKLHEFANADCDVMAGGLRCMYCQALAETEWWPAQVQICCERCFDRVRAGELPEHCTPFPLSYFAIEPTV